MAVNNIIKRIQNIMRQDAGINGDAQRIEQMTWMFFLKVYDTQEETWEYKDENYKSIIPEDLRWRTLLKKDGVTLDGEALEAHYIHILAAFDYQGKIEIVTDWAGAEGFSIDFLQEDGKAFRSLKNDGRYCAPF